MKILFDVVICNHVLEHVKDSHKVMTEFYRGNETAGEQGIFQVPIDIIAKTEEDPNTVNPKERERLY